MTFTHVDFVTNSALGKTNVPPDKPATAQGISDVNAPPSFGGLNQRLTIGAFTSYRISRFASWKAWQANYDAQQTAAAAAADAAARDAAEPLLVAIRDQAQAALDANTTYLAISAPTNAQVIAQVKALTQQMNKVIKAEARIAVKTI